MTEIILVIGATGFTVCGSLSMWHQAIPVYLLLFTQGSLVAEYLGKYPNPTFHVHLGARSPSKLANLISEKNLKNVTSVTVDVTDEHVVERAVLGANVIINCVGPFAKHGANVVSFVFSGHFMAVIPVSNVFVVLVHAMEGITRTSLARSGGYRR